MKKYLILIILALFFSCEKKEPQTATETPTKVEYFFDGQKFHSESEWDKLVIEADISERNIENSQTCNPVTNCLIGYWVITYPDGSTVVEWKVVAFTIFPKTCNAPYFIIQNTNNGEVIFSQQNNMIFYNGHDNFWELLDWAQNDCENLNVVCPNCNNQ